MTSSPIVQICLLLRSSIHVSPRTGRTSNRLAASTMANNPTRSAISRAVGRFTASAPTALRRPSMQASITATRKDACKVRRIGQPSSLRTVTHGLLLHLQVGVMTRKSVSLPGIAVIATLAMFAFSGDFYWNCNGDNSSNTNPPPPTRSITSVTEIQDPLTAANQRNGPCYYDGSQNNTQPHLWHIHYSDNTATDAPILWPWNKTTHQVGTLKYYVTADTPFDIGNAVDAAVRGWNSALTRDVHSSGTINITLVKSTDPY